jgi:hypothetical protein
MSEKAGIGGLLALKTETTVGTYAAPTVGVQFMKESIKRNNAYVKRPTIQSGVISQKDNQHSQTTHDASGDVEFDFLGNGMGPFLNLLHGNVVTPVVVVAATVWKQTHNVGLISPNGKSVSLQVGRPDVGGTVRPFSYTGGKVAVLKLTMERGGVLSAVASMDFMDESTAQTIVVPTYDDLAGTLKFQSATVEFDDVVLTDCASSITITITIPMATDRYCIGGTATKKEQIVNDLISVDVEAAMEFSNLAQHAAFQNATRRKFELNCDGQLIDATNKQHLFTTLPKTVTTDSGPIIEGPDIVQQTIKLEAVQSSTNPLAIFEYQSADSAIA